MLLCWGDFVVVGLIDCDFGNLAWLYLILACLWVYCLVAGLRVACLCFR